MPIKLTDLTSINRQAIAALKPSYTFEQIITQLTTSWGGGDTAAHLFAASASTPSTPSANISFGINTSIPTNFTALGQSSSSEGNGLIAMTALQVTTARLCFQIWDDLIPSSLIESGGADANITLNYSSATTDNGSYTSRLTYNTIPKDIAADQIWLSSNWTTNADSGMVNGGYGLTTLLHEIGHALGLSHPGIYNATSGAAITYEANAEFAQDNRQNTLMSYFGGYDITTHAWTQDDSTNYKYPQTPMVYDIAAIQSLYGTDTATRTGDNIYGYNNNFAASDPEKSIFDFSTNTLPIFTIWDAGGSDELDCSGWSGNQAINLTPGSYSSVCGLNDNVAIAFNTTLEKATGGIGNDTLMGNSADNVLNGGGGNDTIDGSTGVDTAVCGTWSMCTVFGNSLSAIITDLTGINGADTLSNIESLMFNTVTVATEAAVNDAPVGIADNNAEDLVVEEGTGVAGNSVATGNVLTNDTDADSFLGLGETESVQKLNDQSGNIGIAVAGLYGSLTLAANGNYFYILDNAKAATNALSTGQLAADIFTYTVVDAHSASSASTILTISISGGNDAPSLSAFNLAVAGGNEDSEMTMSFADLQAQGNEADVDGTVTAFVIKAVSSGSLKIGSLAETATPWDAAINNTVDATHNAYWTPTANANGILNAFTAVAKDNGGLESIGAVQATVAITSVIDAPSLTAFTSAVANSNEDGEVAVSFADLQTRSNEADVDGTITAFVIKAVSSGSLKIGSSAETAMPWDASINNSVDATRNAYWTPAVNDNGLLNAFTAVVKNNSGLESAGAIQVTVTVAAVNDAPAGANKTVSINEDSDYRFSSADFGYTDVDGNVMASIKITSLPNAGSLRLSGTEVTLDQVIAATAIPDLSFTPTTNANGTDYATFNFSVNDGSLDSVSPNTVTLNVSSINDAPTGTNKTVSIDEDTAYTFSPADFGYADIDGNSMVGIKITRLPVAGSLQLNGAGLALNQVIATASIPDLSFTPAINANGTGYATFNFSVNDGGLDSVSANAITFNVNPVNDAQILAIPNAIYYTDTVFNDRFATVNRKLVASDIDGNVLTYGINGGTDNGNGTVSQNSAYGVLKMTKTSGIYSFTANDMAIEALTVNASADFVVTASDGSLNSSKTLAINIVQNGKTESIGNDRLAGTSGNDKFDSLTGNDIINGLAGADSLQGGLGNDTLNGGTGNDRLTGGAGLDLFRFTTAPTANIDTITDFNVADDTIQLDNAVFSKLTTTGVLNPDMFVKATAAHDSNDYIIYNATTGELLYDADGNGADAAVQIALLGTKLALSHADFVII